MSNPGSAFSDPMPPSRCARVCWQQVPACSVLSRLRKPTGDGRPWTSSRREIVDITCGVTGWWLRSSVPNGRCGVFAAARHGETKAANQHSGHGIQGQRRGSAGPNRSSQGILAKDKTKWAKNKTRRVLQSLDDDCRYVMRDRASGIARAVVLTLPARLASRSGQGSGVPHGQPSSR